MDLLDYQCYLKLHVKNIRSEWVNCNPYASAIPFCVWLYLISYPAVKALLGILPVNSHLNEFAMPELAWIMTWYKIGPYAQYADESCHRLRFIIYLSFRLGSNDFDKSIFTHNDGILNNHLPCLSNTITHEYTECITYTCSIYDSLGD